MANVDLLDNLADISALEAERDRVLSILKSYSDALQDVAKRAGQIEISVKGAKQFSDITRATVDLANATNKRKETVDALNSAESRLKATEDKLAASTKQQADAEIKIQKVEQERLKTMQQKERLEQQQLRTKAATSRAAKTEARDAERATNDYLQLRAAYDQLALKAKNYAVTLGEQHPITLEAINDAKKLNDILYRVEAAVGQNQRNVGNYASAFNGLGNSFAQVSRELPSLTVSAQQFFLAISNNLPIVADEIARAKKEIAALKAEGKDSPSLFSRITSSLFSWQVALSVGITLLVAYGKDIAKFFAELFKGKEAFDAVAEKQKIFSKALEDTNGGYIQAVQNVEELRVNVELAKKGFIDKESVLKQYNDTLGKTVGEAKSLDEVERSLIDNAPAYIQMMALKAAAEIALQDAAKKAVEAQQLRIKSEKEFQTLNDRAATAVISSPGESASEATIKRAQERLKERARLNKEQAILDAKSAEAQLRNIALGFLQSAGQISAQYQFNPFGGKGGMDDKSVRAFFADALKDQAAALKELSKQDQIYIDTRIEARKQAAEIEQNILDRTRAVDVANAKGNKDELLSIDEKYSYEKQKIATDLNSDLFRIQLSYYAQTKDIDKQINDQFLSDQKDAQQAQVESLTKAFEQRKNVLDKERDDELRRLDERFAKGKITEEKYQKERAAIQNKYLSLQLNAEIEYTQAILDLAKARGEDVSKQEAQISNLRLRLAELNKSAIDAEGKDVDKLKEKYQELGFAIADTFKSIVSGSFDRQKNAIQDQIDALDRQKQKDIEVANATIANAQDRADAITVINARAQAKKEQLEARQRQLDIQRAKFEKQFSIARIIAETAIQVIKAGGPLTPMGAILTAFGALSLAQIIATPIPRFKDGRKGGEATLGIVGDGGVQEVLTSPDGRKAFITPDTDTLVNIPQGWSVHKSVDDYRKSMGMRVTKDLPMLPVVSSDTGMIYALKSEMSQLRGVIANKREMYFSWDNGELKRAIRNGNSWTKYIQDNV